MRNTPLLHKKAIDFWETTVSNSKHYLEYGMGGSTIRASELCQGSVTTVETNPKFYDKMLKHLIDANVDVYCMDWECGSLGYPKKELSDKEIRDYAFIPFEEGMKYHLLKLKLKQLLMIQLLKYFHTKFLDKR